ncbi:MAG: tetratricopeptide repeat protein [Verrucomicrobiae bacterium]|nr:tetratricopeptide repeat protein [Verrucomicrobiae bacterium]
MAVVQETELNAGQLETLKRARVAYERNNLEYAITLLLQLVKEAPRYLAGRQLLRDISIKKHGSAKGGFMGLGSVASAPQLLKAQSAAKKNPEEALAVVEQVLSTDPFNKQANELLSQIAKTMDMSEVACLAHETLQRANPQDIKNLHALGRLYLEAKNPKARDVYAAILNIKPNDGEALSNLKNAEAIGTLQKGWASAGSYRDVLADKDTALKLEQESKITKSEEAIDQLIAEHYAKHQAEPKNILHARRIADLYRQKNDHTNALAYYQYAYDLSGKTDPGLEKIMYEVRLKQYDDLIQQWKTFIATNPNDPEIKTHQATLETCEKQRADLVLQEARNRVIKYPNDLQFRFELGEALYQAGDVGGAIPELQAALRQPNARLNAMFLLSLCFKTKGQLDIAAKRLEEASSEVLSMDDMKKNILYHLGLIYEEMKQPEKSINAFKQIYEVDYGYRDVAQRVENFYQKSS